MKAKRNWLIAGMVVGLLLMLALPLGLFSTIVGTIQAFGTLTSSSSGIADPQAFSASVGTTLVSAFVGLALFLVGIVLLLLSLIFFFRLQSSTPPPLPPLPPRPSR